MAPRSGSRTSAALLGAAALLASACPARTPTPATSAGPVRGGAITIGIPEEPSTLDPFAPGGDATATRDLLPLLLPRLPEDAWTPGSDAPRITVPELHWSDDTVVSARDVRFTWQRAKRTDVIADVEVVSDRVAGLTLAAGATERDARAVFAHGLLPAHATPKDGYDGAVAGGPFTLAAWNRGLDMEFARNARAAGGGALLDRVRMVFLPDAGGALEAFRRGDVDALGPYAAPDWQRRIRDAGGTPVVVETGTTLMLALELRARGPFADARVRRAFLLALDRARLVRGLVQAEGALPPGGAGTFDPTEARRLLSDAGWRGTPIRQRRGERLRLTLALSTTTDLAGALARPIQAMTAAVGIDLQLVLLDPPELQTWRTGTRMRAALVASRRGEGTPVAALTTTVSVRASVRVSEATNAHDGPFAALGAWSRA